jgi:hypothetical protein
VLLLEFQGGETFFQLGISSGILVSQASYLGDQGAKDVWSYIVVIVGHIGDLIHCDFLLLNINSFN